MTNIIQKYFDEFNSAIRLPDKRQKTRKLVIELKTNKPCMDCKIIYPYFMYDFDHVRGEKLGNIESIARKGDVQLLMDEVAKCDLVCALCHRLRTFMRSVGRPRVDRPQ